MTPNLSLSLSISLERSLIVSCQASEGEPLCHPSHILALALSAIAGGARGLRLEGAENITTVRPFTTLPIIGLYKDVDVPDSERSQSVYITPTLTAAAALAQAGADIIAIDSTARMRPDGSTAGDLIKAIQNELGKPVMADISTFAEGMKASEMGADFLSTTLYGYTSDTETVCDGGPAFDLLRELVLKSGKPVILEGRIWEPKEVERAFELGAHCVVVGSAITRPQLITERFVKATNGRVSASEII